MAANDARGYLEAMNRRSFSRIRVLAALIVLLCFVPATAMAQSGGDFGQWVRRNNVHQISGYVTLGLATTTAALGIFAPEYHWIATGPTLASSVLSVSLGSIAFRDQLNVYWPHAVLASLATAGFAANLFFLEGGSREHVATGIASVATLYGAYAAILILTR